jgi:hypothetical protein
MGQCGMDLSGLGWRKVAGFCVNGNEPSAFIKQGNFLTR